jgi:hypothetical protein
MGERTRREFGRFELNDLANGLHYALKDPEVQQINFTREQAEIALFALETADAALKLLNKLDPNPTPPENR